MSSSIGSRAQGVGRSLVNNAQNFQKGISKGVSNSGDRVKRTATKISNFQKRINTENKIQDRIEVKQANDAERNVAEAAREAKRLVGPVGNIVKNVIKKPLEGLWKLILGWAIINLPKIIKAVRVFIKKIRVFVNAVKKALRAAGGVFKGMIRIIGAFAQNVKELDFQDRSGRIAKEKDEMLRELDKIPQSFEEMKNVWNKQEEELDRMLESFDAEKDAQIISENAGAKGGTVPVQPTQTVTGDPAGAISTMDGDFTKRLKKRIRNAESNGDYSAMWSGALAGFPRAGEDITKMTINQVHDLQTDYLDYQAALGRPESARSAAMGAYQMLMIKKVAIAMGLDPATTKFDRATQDLMANYYLNVAGYQEYAKGKMSPEEFNDKLAAEFASLKKTSGVGEYDDQSINNAYDSVLPMLQQGQGDAKQEQAEGKAAQQTAPIESSTDTAASDDSGSMPNIPSGQVSGSALTNVLSERAMKVNYGVPSGPVRSRGRTSSHGGIDIATGGQTGWWCSFKRKGKVVLVSTLSGYGETVIIQSGNLDFLFGHFRTGSILVKQGESYNGQVIAELGTTGRSTGIHLHFEVRPAGGFGGSSIDPEPHIMDVVIGRLPQGFDKQTNNPPPSGPEIGKVTSDDGESGIIDKIRTNTQSGVKTITEFLTQKVFVKT